MCWRVLAKAKLSSLTLGLHRNKERRVRTTLKGGDDHYHTFVAVRPVILND